MSDISHEEIEPEHILGRLQQMINDDEIRNVALIFENKDGSAGYHRSKMGTATFIGLMKVLESILLNEYTYSEES